MTELTVSKTPRKAIGARRAERPDRMGAWLRKLLARAHRNVAVVALAGKLARIAWAVLSSERSYRAQSL